MTQTNKMEQESQDAQELNDNFGASEKQRVEFEEE